MKGVLKGFKYISTIFDEREEEEEIQIGLPTDVKHVAHIGTDGPSTESPSWMKDFSSERPKSAPLDSTGETTDECQKTSTDTELPKASRRRHHSVDNVATFERSDRVGTTKSKGSRKHHKKMNSDGSVGKSSRSRHRRKDSLSDQEGSSRSSRVKEDLKGDEPESTSLPDIPKKSRRKKVKDEINKIASKAIPKVGSDGVNDPPPLPPPPRSPPPKTKTKTTTENTSRPFSDPGSVGTDSTTTITCDSESCHITKKPSPPSGGS